VNLFVIRHGQTDYNAERRFQGQADIPLNELGKDQARRAALVLNQLLEAQTPKAVFSNDAPASLDVHLISSDLERTKQTTSIIHQILRENQARLSVQLTFEARLREFHCGLFENSTYEEFLNRHPDIATDYMKRFECDNYGTRYPGAGGESRMDVMERVGSALQDLQMRSPSNAHSHIVWIVHGGVIDVLLELMHIQASHSRNPEESRISAGNGDLLVLKKSTSRRVLSEISVRLGHQDVWQLERHYRVGDTVAARVGRTAKPSVK
jgi:broad specificity phosphatase PhoE